MVTLVSGRMANRGLARVPQQPPRNRQTPMHAQRVSSNHLGSRASAGNDRSQTLLLPESLDDYVGSDNPGFGRANSGWNYISTILQTYL
jgi:hypothetical protein